MGIELLYRIFKKHPIISTDSRNILNNSIFFALKGENFNGNAFAHEALAKGAAFAVVDDKEVELNEQIILVEDVLETLQNLAHYHRMQFDIPVIGITGSNGKTTTKELIQAVLSKKYVVHATKGNLNNHIGVPLTLLSWQEDIEIAIVEMGANHEREIAQLSKIAAPTHGLINNIGKAHLEGFGSFEGVIRAKGELYEYIMKNEGHLFVQGGNNLLLQLLKDYEHYTKYGFKDGDYNEFKVRGELVSASPYLTLNWLDSAKPNVKHTVQTQLAGSYNLENVLASIAVGLYFDVEVLEINHALSEYLPKNQRSEITKSSSNNWIIHDYYNANVSSMVASLTNFADIDSHKKVIILGDMFELGGFTQKEHKNIIEDCLSIDAEHTIFIGNHFFEHKDSFSNKKSFHFFRSLPEAKEYLENLDLRDSWVLVKGSRGMKMENLIDSL